MATWKLFSVTNPELKRAFRKTGALIVLKLALKYPTAQEVAILGIQLNISGRAETYKDGYSAILGSSLSYTGRKTAFNAVFYSFE